MFRLHVTLANCTPLQKSKNFEMFVSHCLVAASLLILGVSCSVYNGTHFFGTNSADKPTVRTQEKRFVDMTNSKDVLGLLNYPFGPYSRQMATKKANPFEDRMITRDNFMVRKNEILEAVRTADFVAWDMEMTGIEDTSRYTNKVDFFANLDAICNTFHPVEIGLVAFEFKDGKYRATPFSLLVGPAHPRDTFVSDTSTMYFLKKHGLDWTKYIEHYIPMASSALENRPDDKRMKPEDVALFEMAQKLDFLSFLKTLLGMAKPNLFFNGAMDMFHMLVRLGTTGRTDKTVLGRPAVDINQLESRLSVLKGEKKAMEEANKKSLDEKTKSGAEVELVSTSDVDAEIADLERRISGLKQLIAEFDRKIMFYFPVFYDVAIHCSTTSLLDQFENSRSKIEGVVELPPLESGSHSALVDAWMTGALFLSHNRNNKPVQDYVKDALVPTFISANMINHSNYSLAKKLKYSGFDASKEEALSLSDSRPSCDKQ